MFPNFTVNTGYGLPVPYSTPISPSLTSGTQIHVTGTPTGSRFEINLKSHQEDIILHFNPRLDDHAIVLNSAQRGSWGSEERHGSSFHRGVRFTVVITATQVGFNISVNNAHFCEFRLRTAMHLAQTLEVKGDINLESAQVYPAMGASMNFPNMGGQIPFVQPSFPQPSFPQPTFPQPFGGSGVNVNFGFPSAPPAAVVTSFPMGGSGVPSIQSCHIHLGSRIYVRGFITPGAKRFELNLLQGYNDTDDIAFHFNPRFDQRQIVKNHRRNGQWGSEENQPFPAYMPLVPGQQIELQILCQQDRYTVFINNQVIAEYYHKITPGAVVAVQYKGDINVTSVGQV